MTGMAINGNQPRPAGLRERGNQWVSDRAGKKRFKTAYPAVPSYSQFGEDIVLQRMLDGVTPGSFIDVGSGHPISGSNTYLLYQQGWRGILIDPIPHNITESRRFRPLDTSVQTLCGVNTGEPVTFYEYTEWQYSTTSFDRVQELASLGHHLATQYAVPVMSPGTIATQMLANDPSAVNVLSIDVEGGELDVLNSNKWDCYRPDIIVVEEWSPPLGQGTVISRYLGEFGYRLEAVAGVISFYRN